MARKKAIHQIMPAFLYADALGNQAFRIRELLRQWGYHSQIYTPIRDQRHVDPGLDLKRYASDPGNVVIVHYAIGSEITDFARRLPDTVVPYYHNVTPPEFFRDYNPGLVGALERGRRDLILFRDAPLALAASEYNCQEMLALGFKQVEVLPYFIHMDQLLASADSPAGREVIARYADGSCNILFVGRLAPNKRQDDLIRAFNYYQRLINPRSRLLLVGSDGNAPGYRLELETLAAVFDLKEVYLVGPAGTREGLGGYYRAADVFLCLSEHEGFCVPLLEAMAFDVPVLAYNKTGVPYALGESGILFNHKRYDVIAETIHTVVTNRPLRDRIVARQRLRLQDFAPDAIASRLSDYVKRVT